MAELAVVTGAFSYTGRYIARRLFEQGWRVRALTGHPERAGPWGNQVEVARLDFREPKLLVAALGGAGTFFNTYWVRFRRGPASFEQAVANSRMLFEAARDAGVGRIVHLSVTQASAASPLPYYRGKGEVEGILKACGLPYAIVRPTLIFGLGDILINNIAWLLRRFPVFAIPGSGQYRVQPVSAEDVAQLAVTAAAAGGSQTLDAAGPETYTYNELVRLMARALASKARVVHLPPGAALLLSRLVGVWVRDVVLTRDELAGLMANLLVSAAAPTGQTLFSRWLQENRDQLGVHYASELARHFR